MYMHVYTMFAPYSPSKTLSPLVPTPQTGPVLPSFSMILFLKMTFLFVEDSYTGSFLLTFLTTCINQNCFISIFLISISVPFLW
jgi:hypothetical protein